MGSGKEDLRITTAIAVGDDTDLDAQSYLKRVQDEADKINLVLYHHHDDDHSEMIVEENRHLAMDDDVWSTMVMESFLSLKSKMLHHTFEKHETPARLLLNSNSIFQELPPDYLILKLQRRECFAILSRLTRLITVSVNSAFSQWIWQIFIRIDNILEANECSIMRDLAKRAIHLKRVLGETEGEGNVAGQTSSIAKFTFDMIIIIVGKYYRQSDLLPLSDYH
ncbi:hypothetical protein KGF56_004382 [Candida oxycetoniae]|uniref:Uncharacterized protein n=1 Tax=Candida oxycetoniae TaxID=497107 RepID=A0AAI9SU53_9ASCO|nr:uncharacterized protein KGF56_004382 [Candida oxycetoniae]KAI3402921.2 hypothetical protein KGF56_004382 [Candida oxycetoniae]